MVECFIIGYLCGKSKGREGLELFLGLLLGPLGGFLFFASAIKETNALNAWERYLMVH
jgi:hypothetical protein